MEAADEDVLLIEIIKFLKDTPLFRHLTFRQLVEVSNNIEIEEFDLGAVLFSPELPLKEVCVIMEGKIGLYSKNKSGEEIKLIELAPKDSLGVIAFFDKELLEKKAVAESNVKLIYISLESFGYIIENYDEIQDGLIAEMSNRIKKYEI